MYTTSTSTATSTNTTTSTSNSSNINNINNITSTLTAKPGASRVSNVDLEEPGCSYQVDLNSFDNVDHSEVEQGDGTSPSDTEVETTEMETEGSIYEPPRKAIRRKKTEPIQNVIDSSMTKVLDRFQIPNDTASIIIGQVAFLLGHDVKSLHLFPEHIRKQRIKCRNEIYNAIRNEFSPNAVFTVHWDGKVLADCTSVNQLTCNRLAIILSSIGNSKVLVIPKIRSQKRSEEGIAVYSALIDWDVQEKVMAMCFDTTASNTSTSIGACAILEQQLNRQLLYFACRHHIMELLVAGAFQTTVEPTKSAPNILLFERFRSTWPQLDHDSFEPGITDPEVAKYSSETIRMELINFIKHQIENKFDGSRYDYIEFLKLSLLFLGEAIPGYKIAKAGAVSRARWMGKNIYSIKIFLFRKQFKISGKLSKDCSSFGSNTYY